MATANKPSVAFDADTVVVITGSSRGLGLNLVKGILETTDSKVVATARNVAKASALSELQAKYPERVQLVNLDTGSEDSIKAAAAEVAKQHDGIDLLFNNAGIDEGVDACCLDVPVSKYEEILKINVLGPFTMTTNFLPLLRKKQSRAVVNMSSGLASISTNRLYISDHEKMPLGNRWIAYNSSKAALNMQTSVFANQLKDEGFCVIALNPGWVDTDMGGGNARKLGMEKAPMDTDTSIKMQLKVLQGLTTKSNGQFLSYDNKKIDD
ncbi:hypothetical protein ABBQ38_007732 [Trebouxia sp. C0009 RCD-2024]